MKARSDSLFSRLKPAQRDELLQMLCEAGVSVEDALKKCAAWGVKTSAGSVSRFYSSQAFAWRLDRARAAAAVTADVSPASLEEAEKRLVGQKVFEILARADTSDKSVLKIRDQQIKKHQLSLLERKITFQEASSRAKAGVEEAGKKLEITPDVIKEILAAVDRRLMGEA